MKNIIRAISLSVLVAGLLCFASCKENVVHGKGNITSQQRQTAVFDKIVIDMAVDATIIVGDAHAVQVKAHDNLQEHIKVDVTGNTLRIHKSGIMFSDDDIHVTIHLPVFAKLEINGAADADIQGDVKGESFELHVRGASDVDMQQVHVDKLNVKLSGASELRIDSGVVSSATYNVTGAGEIDASKLQTKKAIAKVSGAGEMSLNVTEKLDAKITGAGEIDYTGHPQVSSKITGAGVLNDRN